MDKVQSSDTGRFSKCASIEKSQTQSIVYKVSVKTDDDVQKEYTGLTAMSFKQRFYNHLQSMRDHKYRNSTTLSKYVWSLKDSKVGYTMKWSIHSLQQHK